MTNTPNPKLIEAVQHNCHIADARHAGDYTLCVYLLKMREFYRWEYNHSFQTQLTNDSVGDWLTDREGHWDDLEDEAFINVPLQEGLEPFENEAINAALVPQGLIYNAGYGIRCRPHFFLGALKQQEQQHGFTVYISGKEYARDIAAPAAMNQGKDIYIREESLRRMLWEKIEEWRWSSLDNPMGRALAAYDFEQEPEAALTAFAEAVSPQVIQHEIGEAMAGEKLGEDWSTLIFSLPRSKAEIMLRAIRDHLADSLTTLPTLIAKPEPTTLHFFFAHMTNMRKELAPSLRKAYEVWYENGDVSALEACIEKAQKHWLALALDCLALYQTQADDISAKIEQLVNDRHF